MKPGQVTTIRVNPKDCMSVVDVLAAVGMDVKGMSFSSMVSLALSSLLETARQHEVIPTRDGFEYLDVMGPFLGQGRNKRKLQVTDTISQVGSKIKVAGLRKPHAAIQLPQEEPEQPPSVDQLRARTRLGELLQKKDLAETAGSGVYWQESDQKEFDDLYRVVYPHG